MVAAFHVQTEFCLKLLLPNVASVWTSTCCFPTNSCIPNQFAFLFLGYKLCPLALILACLLMLCNSFFKRVNQNKPKACDTLPDLTIKLALVAREKVPSSRHDAKGNAFPAGCWKNTEIAVHGTEETDKAKVCCVLILSKGWGTRVSGRNSLLVSGL